MAGGSHAGTGWEFLQARRACGYTLLLSQRALVPLLGYLRDLGVVPDPPPAKVTPAEMLAGDYRRYLLSERGLSAASVSAYLAAARLFLGELGQSGGLDLGKLTAGQVRGFAVVTWLAAGGVGQDSGSRAAVAASVLVPGRPHPPAAGLGGAYPGWLCGGVPAPGGGARGGGARWPA